MEKVLTVLVPAYQVEKYIVNNIESLVQVQNSDLLEILIVDDGSTDQTGVLADALAEKYKNCVRVIHQPNGGHGETINTGIRESKGRYFKVVDGDDWVEKEGLEKLIACLTEAKEDIVFTDYKEVYDNSKNEKLFRLPFPASVTLNPDAMQLDILLSMHSYTCRTQILRRLPRAIDKHCFYVDMEYILFPLLFVKTVRYEPYCVYCYRLEREGQSVSPEGFRKHVREHEKVLLTLVEYYEKYVKLSENEKEKNEKNAMLSYYFPQRISDMMLRHILKCCWYLKDKDQNGVGSISAYLRRVDKQIKDSSPFLYEFYKQIETRKGSLSNLQLRFLRATGFRIWPIVRFKKVITERWRKRK